MQSPYWSNLPLFNKDTSIISKPLLHLRPVLDVASGRWNLVCYLSLSSQRQIPRKVVRVWDTRVTSGRPDGNLGTGESEIRFGGQTHKPISDHFTRLISMAGDECLKHGVARRVNWIKRNRGSIRSFINVMNTSGWHGKWTVGRILRDFVKSSYKSSFCSN